MTALDLIIDAMLPGAPELGMPSASQVDFDLYLRQQGVKDFAQDFVAMIDRVSAFKFGRTFAEMDPTQRLQAVNACKLDDIRLFTTVVTHLLKAYYTAPAVLHRLQVGSVPPFPQGNLMPSDDWTLLEPVYDRGPIHREISQEDPNC
jgi:hypothetical protein